MKKIFLLSLLLAGTYGFCQCVSNVGMYGGQHYYVLLNSNKELLTGNGNYANVQLSNIEVFSSPRITQRYLAIKSDGTLWGQGNNDKGQLGDGSTLYANGYKQVGTSINWKNVSAGEFHSLGIKTDGTLWSWGNNSSGELGNGTNVVKRTPNQMSSGTDWKIISAGDSYSLAIKNDGTLWGWGSNGSGQVGLGNTGSIILIPTQIGTSNEWKYIDAGMGTSFGIKNDGTLWAWGFNSGGLFGDGTYINSTLPRQIGNSNNWKIVKSGVSSTLAVKIDGTLWSTGLNDKGQVGDGTYEDTSLFIQIGSSNDWSHVAAGYGSNFGLKSDGNLYQWGDWTDSNIPINVFTNSCNNLSFEEPSINAFKVITYPNPFTNEFVIDLNTLSQKSLNIKVYDIKGSLIEQRQLTPSKVFKLNIGNNYPTGIYNLIVTQEEETKSLQVIKQ